MTLDRQTDRQTKVVFASSILCIWSPGCTRNSTKLNPIEQFNDVWRFYGNFVNPAFKEYGLMTTTSTVYVQEGLSTVGNQTLSCARVQGLGMRLDKNRLVEVPRGDEPSDDGLPRIP